MTVESCASHGDPPLIGDGDQSGPRRCGQTGATHVVPWAAAGVVVRVVDRYTRVMVGVKRDVGGRSVAGVLDGFLIGWLGLVGADASSAIVPADLTLIGAV